MSVELSEPDRARWLARLYDWEAAHFLHDQLRDVPFFLEHSAPGDRLLEIGCGTGRVSLRLADARRDVFAIDIDEAMLERAVARGLTLDRAARDRLEFSWEDMRDFALGRRFDQVLIPYNTLQLLDGGDERRAALGAIRAHLRDGGRLVICIHGFGLEAEPRAHVLTDYLDDERTVVAMYDATIVEDPAHVRFETDYEITPPDGDAWQLRGELRIERIPLEDLRSELSDSGFALDEVAYGPAGTGQPEPVATGPIVAVATRAG
jgi:SAM-dependent methyltransferase